MAGLCEGGNEPPGSLKVLGVRDAGLITRSLLLINVLCLLGILLYPDSAPGLERVSDRVRGKRNAGTGSICNAERAEGVYYGNAARGGCARTCYLPSDEGSKLLRAE
ncbi:hypothetical protein ANN_23734 [Periplaneta americana]|uniref:Uncharacterized protein n=1 Tax=Periplaneta americana TaxID=6978 RepID=A0ABQ8SMD3_PERAM|nr:hypothetical protein ANN_23734 [Periplaneta americana]